MKCDSQMRDVMVHTETVNSRNWRRALKIAVSDKFLTKRPNLSKKIKNFSKKSWKMRASQAKLLTW